MAKGYKRTRAKSMNRDNISKRIHTTRRAGAPPRDLIALALWAWSFAGDTVTWRGERFLLKRGKLIRIQPPSAPSG
jgi:hypothetical protein